MVESPWIEAVSGPDFLKFAQKMLPVNRNKNVRSKLNFYIM